MFTRRSFLKLGFGALCSLAFRGLAIDPAEDQHLVAYPFLGRTIYSLRYYESPSLKSKELGYYNTDSVVEVYQVVLGDPKPENNPLWYRTERGFIHSSYVQPVKNLINETVESVPAGGFLAEVTVPYAQAWINQQGELKRSYRFYYASTHWVMWKYEDDTGKVWYKIKDDLKDQHYYVGAKYLRRIESHEISPLSPLTQDKRIVIDLAAQKLSAYENGREVMTARVSTGTFEGDTPLGEFRVERKQPSRHMAANEARGNGFDLPGVPWVCYISWTGVSLHGTYWHNDYGQPRSHGCINLAPEAARWIYRWTTPNVPIDVERLQADHGTPVVVV